MLLQLYTKLNLELVHQHARQLKPVVYYKKTVVCSPLFEGSAEGQGLGWRRRGVDVPTEDSRRKGGALPLQIRRRRPASGAARRRPASGGARPTTNRSAPQQEGSRPFFLPKFFPLSSSAGGLGLYGF
jgi:hypothetical protein